MSRSTPTEPTDIIQLTGERISIEALQEQVLADCQSGKYGVVLTFSGIVRNVDDRDGQQEHIQAIDYETYTELFLGETQRLISQVRGIMAGQLGQVVIVHRFDKVQVGEVTAAMVVAAVHRQDALKAIELLTDGMKARVPIWKKIIRQDGKEKLVRTSE